MSNDRKKVDDVKLKPPTETKEGELLFTPRNNPAASTRRNTPVSKRDAAKEKRLTPSNEEAVKEQKKPPVEVPGGRRKTIIMRASSRSQLFSSAQGTEESKQPDLNAGALQTWNRIRSGKILSEHFNEARIRKGYWWRSFIVAKYGANLGESDAELNTTDKRSWFNVFIVEGDQAARGADAVSAAMTNKIKPAMKEAPNDKKQLERWIQAKQEEEATKTEHAKASKLEQTARDRAQKIASDDEQTVHTKQQAWGYLAQCEKTAANAASKYAEMKNVADEAHVALTEQLSNGKSNAELFGEFIKARATEEARVLMREEDEMKVSAELTPSSAYLKALTARILESDYFIKKDKNLQEPGVMLYLEHCYNSSRQNLSPRPFIDTQSYYYINYAQHVQVLDPKNATHAPEKDPEKAAHVKENAAHAPKSDLYEKPLLPPPTIQEVSGGRWWHFFYGVDAAVGLVAHGFCRAGVGMMNATKTIYDAKLPNWSQDKVGFLGRGFLKAMLPIIAPVSFVAGSATTVIGVVLGVVETFTATLAKFWSKSGWLGREKPSSKYAAVNPVTNPQTEAMTQKGKPKQFAHRKSMSMSVANKSNTTTTAHLLNAAHHPRSNLVVQISPVVNEEKINLGKIPEDNEARSPSVTPSPAATPQHRSPINEARTIITPATPTNRTATSHHQHRGSDGASGMPGLVIETPTPSPTLKKSPR